MTYRQFLRQRIKRLERELKSAKKSLKELPTLVQARKRIASEKAPKDKHAE